MYLVISKIYGSEIQETDQSWSYSFEYYLNMDVNRSSKMMIPRESFAEQWSVLPKDGAPLKRVIYFSCLSSQ